MTVGVTMKLQTLLNASLVVSICPLISVMLGYQPAPRIRPYYAL